MEINLCLHCMNGLAPGTAVCPKCGTKVGEIRKLPVSLAPGSILQGKYLVGDVLGQGGFGITYIGYNLLLEIPVAIKEYFPSNIASRSGNTIQWHTAAAQHKEGFDSFLKEARKMAKLKNVPSVVGVQDVFLENDTAYIVMEYIEGQTLAKKLQREGAMHPEACVELLRPIMEDMIHVHEAGIIHRDIKPDNIMICPDGKAMLLDLGAAKELTAAQMAEGKNLSSSLVVSQGFSPFEQYTTNSKIGPWTDVYAMCATIYYCTTGKVLPTAMDRMDNDTPIDYPPYFSASFKKALNKGLALRSKDRIQSMQELLQLLSGSASAPKPQPEPSPQPKPAPEPEPKPVPKPEPKPKPKAKWLIAAGLMVILAVFFITNGKSKGNTFVPVTEPTVKISAQPAAKSAEIVDSGKCGSSAKWELSKDGTLYISGTGEMTDYEQKSSDGKQAAPWSNYREIIHSVVINNGITTVGNHAFDSCVNLTSISISNTVTLIGNYAFHSCTSLTSATIPYGVTKIGYSAFDSCKNLVSVKIPNSVTTIGTCAFAFCKSLASVTIPDSITAIPLCAFDFSTGITSVTIPDSVKTIDGCAFRDCTYLTDIHYSGSKAQWNQISTDDDTWKNVSATVHCSNGTVKIGAQPAAKDGTAPISAQPAAKSAEIVDSGKCGSSAKWELSKDGTLYISGTGEMADYEWDKDAKKATQPWNSYYQTITSAVIEDGISDIGDYAFQGCYNLTSVTISDSVTSIGVESFFSCRRLPSVIIPDSVTSIGKSAFGFCEALTSVTIPDSVTSIGGWSFRDCKSLTDIHYSGSKAQWSKISTNDNTWKNFSATVHCSNGTVKIG